MSLDLSGARRCPSCGSRVHSGDRQCAICGQTVPWSLGLTRTAVESAVVVVLVIAVAAGLVWVRRSRSGPVAEGPAAAGGLVGSLPTEMPTFTPGPTATASRAANTADPPTPTPLPDTVTHVVTSGDTLYGIAAQYGVQAGLLIEVNALERPDALSIGQQLLIPVTRPASAEAEPTAAASGEGVVAGAPGDGSAAATPDSAAGTLDPGGAPAEAPPTGVPIVVREAERHAVGAGDTLGGIADRYGVSVETLLAQNADWLTGADQVLGVGDEVVVRSAEVVTTTPEPALAGGTAAPLADVGPVGITTRPAPSEFGSPLALAPLGGLTVTEDAALLRWASVGLLPAGAYYVVALRERGNTESEAELTWVLSNATAMRVPSRFRPALGATRDLEWTVSVRRRGGLLGSRQGIVLSQPAAWQRFTWAPGRAMQTSSAP